MTGFFQKHFKKIWWSILLLLCSYYVYINRIRVTSVPNTIDTIIILSMLIVMFMPLVTEISAFGMSIKKEIVNSKNEMKNEIDTLKNYLFSFAINNVNKTDVNVYSDRAFTKEEIEKANMINAENNSVETGSYKDIEIYKKYSISDTQVFLYHTRYVLEKRLEELGSEIGIDINTSSKVILTILRHKGIIKAELEDSIFKVLSICNRGIHGEVVDKEYIGYINVVMQNISKEISKIDVKPEKMSFVACSRCGYVGDSAFENQCPKCKFITDEC